MKLRRTIVFFVLGSRCVLGTAQNVSPLSVSLKVRIDLAVGYMYGKFDSTESMIDYYAIGTVEVRNVGHATINVNKKTILNTEPTRFSFFVTEIEQADNDETKECTDSSDVAPIRCNVDVFTGVDDYTINKVEVAPGEHYIFESALSCFLFQKGKTYRARVSIDKGKTGLEGRSEWVYFKAP